MVFKDAKGVEWSVDVTIGSAQRVKSLLGFDLLRMNDGDPPLLATLSTDLLKLANVIYAICKPQADSRSVSDEEFGARLDGDVMARAAEAFWEGMVRFFEAVGQKSEAAKIRKMKEAIATAVRMVTEKVEVLDATKAIAESLGMTSTSGQASSASNPAG